MGHVQCDQIKIGKCLCKLIVAKGFKKLPKMQKIAQSGHTGHAYLMPLSEGSNRPPCLSISTRWQCIKGQQC